MTAPVRLQAALSRSYAIERELGSGGMATVYLAEDLKHQRKVAVKVLRQELSATLGSERFAREIAVAARLQHPHILGLLDSGEADGFFYYVMPYVDGETLRDRLIRGGELPVNEAVRLLGEITDALAAAHKGGVVHRDIKPENILLSGRHAMVMDFGVAKAVTESTGAHQLTSIGVALGTPAYMAPEQATADPQMDGRVDIYALGVLAYEMLTGQPPFHGLNPQQTLAAHVTQAPTPLGQRRPGLSPVLESVVMRCLAKRPADRFQTADELVTALEPLTTPSGGTTPHARARAKNPADRFEGSAAFARALREGHTAVRLPRSRWGAVALAGVVIVVVGVLAMTLRHRVSTAAAGVDPHSIAVLAFDNVSADSGNDYFSDGLSDELRTALQRLPGLTVAARSSSLRFKGSRLGARAIGESLHVATVLEGSVRRNGTALRISPTLTNVATGYGVWADQYDRTLRDVFELQEEVARGIVMKIAPQLLPERGKAIMRQGTADADAYDLYLKGRHALSFRTGPEFEKAAAFFQQAIKRDPMFARAHAGLADSYCIQANFNYRLSKDVCPQSREEANRALALDSTLAEAHAALGFVYLFYDWDIAAAERELNNALALDSTYASAHLWLMHVFRIRRDTGQALAHMRRAVALDSSLIMRSRLGFMLSQSGRDADAIAEFERLLQADSTFEDAKYQLGLAYLHAHEYDRALAWSRAHGFDDLVAIADARLGRAAEAQAIASHLAALQDANLWSLALCNIFAALGDRPAAMKWLEKAYGDRVPDVVFIRSFYGLESLKGFGPFEALAKKVGVP